MSLFVNSSIIFLDTVTPNGVIGVMAAGDMRVGWQVAVEYARLQTIGSSVVRLIQSFMHWSIKALVLLYHY